MKCVQDALRSVIADGVPVQAGIWRSETADRNPPDQYVVYSTTTTEKRSWDDQPRVYQVYVYLDFWSKVDPTPTKLKIRKAMYDAGFGMISESDKGYNQPVYDHYTHQYGINWTWCIYTEDPE